MKLVKESLEELRNQYLATAPMDEPGEVNVQWIDEDQVDEYREADWDIMGPMTQQEANIAHDKITGNNADWKYYDSVEDDY